MNSRAPMGIPARMKDYDWIGFSYAPRCSLSLRSSMWYAFKTISLGRAGARNSGLPAGCNSFYFITSATMGSSGRATGTIATLASGRVFRYISSRVEKFRARSPTGQASKRRAHHWVEAVLEGFFVVVVLLFLCGVNNCNFSLQLCLILKREMGGFPLPLGGFMYVELNISHRRRCTLGGCTQWRGVSGVEGYFPFF